MLGEKVPMGWNLRNMQCAICV